jgi:hypothetical protein
MLLQPSRYGFLHLFSCAMVAGAFCASAAHAALNITPPQLAPDQNGIIATEVKSSLTTPSRWSVRVIVWDPTAKEPANRNPAPAAVPISTSGAAAAVSPAKSSAAVLPQSATSPATSAAASALGTAAAPLGVDISPRFFSLAPAGRQVIRARVSDRTRHYRLLIEQIPDDSLSSQGVNFRFRFSLPIFRSSQDPLIPRGIVIQ